MQTATGGPIRGDIATTSCRPTSPATTSPTCTRPPARAARVTSPRPRMQLKAVRQAGGFNTNHLRPQPTVRSEIDAATAIVQASLKKVGINAGIKQYPSGKYFTDYAGVPTFDQKHEHRPDHDAVGRRLADRLRLPAADRRTARPSAVRQHQPVRAERPRRQQAARRRPSATPTTRPAPRRGPRSTRRSMEQARPRAADLPQGPAVPPGRRDQPGRHLGLQRSVRLPEHRQ